MHPQQGDLRFSGPSQARVPGAGSNPQQKGPCRSQGGFAIHCATDTPSMHVDLPEEVCKKCEAFKTKARIVFV
ncbi:hypothetical protein PoB_003713300 [Plakobranchus ocellatus]|uniref:Uncharacterized protein n=1 Tax=Plakobranchus ocellatus TaxID=259542 RepID=A0AAV4ATB0_9GAST|nr:hypothetical protein PoB_003713300 [Plakobranchus ocellatus]